jgi:hypothetical protein
MLGVRAQEKKKVCVVCVHVRMCVCMCVLCVHIYGVVLVVCMSADQYLFMCLPASCTEACCLEILLVCTCLSTKYSI